MAIHLTKGDITSLDTDCIVNAANESRLFGGQAFGKRYTRRRIILLKKRK